MRRPFASVLMALACPLAAQAQTLVIKDWQAVCDNTRTCRVVGYQRDGDAAWISVLFTRQAGARSGVYGELSVGGNPDAAPAPASVRLTIAGKPAGTVALERQSHHAALAGGVVESLLKALVANAPVTATSGKGTWRLSGDGAREALEKMDELQGRTGTTTAIVRPGSAGADAIVLPMSAPTVRAVRIGAARAGDDDLAARIVTMIPHDDDCPMLDDSQSRQGQAPRLWHLDANRVLVSARCHAGMDDAGAGYWIANLRPPFAAQAVTLAGTGFDGASTLTSAQRSRCGADQTWTWNGFQFELTASSGSGLCRGGSWDLPLVITQVIPAN
jgi:hypothetical protein